MESPFIGPTWVDSREERDEIEMRNLMLAAPVLMELGLGHSTSLTWRD